MLDEANLCRATKSMLVKYRRKHQYMIPDAVKKSYAGATANNQMSETVMERISLRQIFFGNNSHKTVSKLLNEDRILTQ